MRALGAVVSSAGRKRLWGAAVAALIGSVAMLLWITPTGAETIPGDLTTVSEKLDGAGHCLDPIALPACNVFDGTAYAWVGGEPAFGELPDGEYFFAVLDTAKNPNPNDGSDPANLSDDFDPYTNRDFTVVDGEIAAYTGTHDVDGPVATGSLSAQGRRGASGTTNVSSALTRIRLSPYRPAQNVSGVYQLAVCAIAAVGGRRTYPVDPRNCRFDLFKVPGADHVPPQCPRPEFGVNADGQRTVRQVFTDGGGIDSLTVREVRNANWTLSNFYRGTPGPVTITATKLDQSVRSFIEIYVQDVAGNRRTCDPVLATMRPTRQGTGIQRFTRLGQDESKIDVHNGRPGYRTVRITVNARHFRTVGLRAGQTRKFDVARLMRPGKRNTIVVRGTGAPGATADIVIAN